MLQDLFGSLASASAYRRFAAQGAPRAALYLAFLSLLFAGLGTAAMRLRLGPVMDETFAWLEREVPPLTFAGGKVTTPNPAPVRLAHPRAPEAAIVIDTLRAEPVTAETLREAKAIAFLASSAFYVEQKPGQMRVYDFSKSDNPRPLVVDSAFFREAASTLKTVAYPAAALTIFLVVAAWTALAALLFAAAAAVACSLAGSPRPFGALYKIALHAQTFSTLLRAGLSFATVPLPGVGLVSIAVTAAYLWLGVRAAAEPAPAAPSAEAA